MKKKKKKIVFNKRKINKTNLWAIIVSGVVIFGFICLLIGVAIIASMLKSKPTLNLSDFEQVESSVIYDESGNEIANLGSVIRKNSEYADLPNCLIDAFTAIEDSRFFEHNGFDLPRMVKSAMTIVTSGGDTITGGSTFTMQLVKNTYFVDDETGEEAARSGVSGIKRKIQEIALALELEKYEPKEFILESYLNKLNFGVDRNARGIEKAAQYYFAKDVNQLNVNEAAFLAGVINGPYYYCPFTQDSDGEYHIEQAQDREEEVLYQMYHHGYISKSEYDLAKSVQIIDLLSDPYKKSHGIGDGIPYQAYIDAVVNEVMDLTGLDPYSNTMHIYTYMNKNIQEQMDEIQAQTSEDYLAFPDDYIECASVCINNATGQVVGILGGRNYAGGGQLLLNHATEQHKQPGSSIKPILDYALAFEALGWSTDHVLTDKQMYLDESNEILVYNFSHDYQGDMTIQEAVGNSVNTCAVQTLQQVLDTKKYEYVLNYTKSLGYDFNLDDFNVQYAIGGSTCEVTPLQHAAAYAAIMNYGVYNTPHTVSRIEFTNGKSPITPVYESKQVLSDAASYMTSELMKNNVQSYGGSYNVVKNDNYVVYGKTGTTDYGKEAEAFGVPSGAYKDNWLIAATSEYTTATWVGYEKAAKGQPSYITNSYYQTRPQAKIAHLILDACYEYGGKKPITLSKPSTVTNITHILGVYPYLSSDLDGINFKDNSLIQISTGLIKADAYKLTKNYQIPEIQTMDETRCSAKLESENYGNASLHLTWPTYPDKDKLKVAGATKSTSLPNLDNNYEGKVLFDDSWICGAVRYKAQIIVDGQPLNNGDVTNGIISSTENDRSFYIGNVRGAKSIVVNLFYGYENADLTSNVKSIDVNTADIQSKADLPTGASVSEISSWCERNGVNFKQITTANEYVKNDGDYAVVSYSGKVYTPGMNIVFDEGSYTCYYLSLNKEASVRILMNSDGSYKYTLTNLDSSEIRNVEWSCSDRECEIQENGDTVYIKLSEGVTSATLTVTITTTSGRITASITI